ncbi:transglutaminase family protein [Lysobacter sp. CA199]|uniref:transglutaminase family protein n=1 Tax=Lysobacter sp. CA199 TaxID=3455608 RepID=UPI003F8D5391
MHLKISHRSQYLYSSPMHHVLQRLRLIPRDNPGQTVRSWQVRLEGAVEEFRYNDHFDNATCLVSADGAANAISVIAEGEVETCDTAGVTGPHRSLAPLWLFAQETALTTPGAALKELAASIPAASDLDRLHRLMGEIRARVAYVTGSTDASTTAELSYLQGEGVCQDHAHIFVAVARELAYPARYVSGYLLLNDRTDQVASHAWAEAHVADLGWVSFDPSNGICIDEHYVRLACGRDYRDAMPISGMTFGLAQERLDVKIRVEQ